MANRISGIIVGVIAIGIGVLWILQGLDLLGQSGGMNGHTMWSWIGAVAVAGGLAILYLSIRGWKRS
jgi:hypothetical protein